MRRFRPATLAAFVLAGLAFLLGTGAGAESDDDDSPAKLKAELAALKREVRELKQRVAALEAKVATAPVVSQVVPEVKPEISPELGFVFPGMPRGSAGSAGSSDLARAFHEAVTKGQSVDSLVAFDRSAFLIPESLWNKAASGLDAVTGVPARDELELAVSALRRSGEGSKLEGIVPVHGVAPNGNGALAVLDMTVGTKGKPERYRLVAAEIGGRWFVAHFLSLSAEEDARAFLQDLVQSQKAFFAFHSGKAYAKTLKDLARERADLENSENLKQAGLTFPFAARLDRLDRDQLAWSDDELRGPFYSYKLVGETKWNETKKQNDLSWWAEAMPRSASYPTFSVRVGPDAKLEDPVPVTTRRGPAPPNER